MLYGHDEDQVDKSRYLSRYLGFFHYSSCNTRYVCVSILKMKQRLWPLLGGHSFSKTSC